MGARTRRTRDITSQNCIYTLHETDVPSYKICEKFFSLRVGRYGIVYIRANANERKRAFCFLFFWFRIILLFLRGNVPSRITAIRMQHKRILIIMLHNFIACQKVCAYKNDIQICVCLSIKLLMKAPLSLLMQTVVTSGNLPPFICCNLSAIFLFLYNTCGYISLFFPLILAKKISH